MDKKKGILTVQGDFIYQVYYIILKKIMVPILKNILRE